MEKEEKADDQWELLPPNTSFLGLEDIKDLFSKEIDYIDYFIEQPLIQSDQLDKPQVDYDEDFVQQMIKVEDPKQKTICKTTHDLKDSTSINDHKDKEDFNDHKPCSDRRCRRRRRPLVAGIGELLSIGAAVAAAMVCGFLLGSGRRHEQQRFQIFTDDKAMKQMVREANRINQVLVASASGMPPPAMQPAAISFGGCFNDML